MSANYQALFFTPSVRDVQARMGSRAHYEAAPAGPSERDALTAREADFIAERDFFYQATVGETGWPYVQFRGAPRGFVKLLDRHTLAYADFRGNMQYISSGNLGNDDRVSLIFMDYARQRRLKLAGHARLVEGDVALMERLQLPGYRARPERAVIIDVEGFDWNCPQHITPRFTEEEVAAAQAPLLREIEELKRRLAGA